MQSPYKKQHSTETALLSVQNDLLMAIDNNQLAILILLDLSTAFHTIDHDLLFRRIDVEFVVRLLNCFDRISLAEPNHSRLKTDSPPAFM